MTINKSVGIFSVAMITSCILLSVLIIKLYNTSLNNNKLVEQELKLTILAKELSVSSSDLTSFVRMFAITGNPKYEQAFIDLLSERSGQVPRKMSKAIAPGESIGLTELMRINGCTNEELEKASSANELSDDLAILETEAMYAVKGFFKDDSGQYTVKKEPNLDYAISLIFSDVYNSKLEKIQKPLNEFFIMLRERTHNETLRARETVLRSIGFLAFAILLVLLLAILAIWYSRVRICRPLQEISNSVKKISSGNLEVTISPANNDEIGILAHGITTMVKHLTELIAQAKEKTNEIRMAMERTEIAICDAKIAQEAQERAEDDTKVKSQFLANMSHEIRTPMNAILGLSDVLISTKMKDKNLEHAKNIRQSASVLLKIINDILDISKLEAKRLELIPIHYMLMPCINHVSSLLRGMALDKKLDFQLAIHGDTNICLYGDDIRLRQVLINLLSNAIKFTEKGTVNLDVYAKDDCIDFVIKDSGIGIKEDEINQVFNAFHQIDKVKNRKIQGTGLGLAICHNIVELMNGTITIKSIYGEGATFTLTIPKVLGDETLSEQDNSQQLSFTAKDAHVLVVDDMDINLYVAKALLEKYEVNVVTSSSSAEAIQCIQDTKFDLVFMDYYMPETNGLDTTKAIRALGPQFAELPIIALTANAMPEDKIRCKKATMNDFLSKPIEQEKLHIILERWIPVEKRIYKD